MATDATPVKPKVGMLVRIPSQRPGKWQILSQHPDKGHWWLQAWDDEAKAAGWSVAAAVADMVRT